MRRADGTELARWYVPDDTLAAWVPDEATWRALRGSNGVDWVGRHQPAYKLEAGLLDGASDAPRLWTVDLVPGHPGGDVAAELEALGARVLEHVFHRGQSVHDLELFVVEARPRDLARLAWIEGIRLIQARGSTLGGPLERELDARAVAELTQLVRSGRPLSSLPERALGGGADATRVLLELLAWDDPELRIELTSFEDEGEAPKNVLLSSHEALDGRAGRTRDAAPLASGSAALARALERSGGSTAAQSGLVTRDVPSALGFQSPTDGPAELELLCHSDERPLHFALAWNDEPGTTGPGTRRLNDLDLVVTAPDGTLYRGSSDALTPTPPSGAREGLSTAESVRIEQPAVGRWRASVRPVRGAFALSQGYALAVTGNVLATGGAQTLVVPVTTTLQASAGRFASGAQLAAADLALLRTRDDARLQVRDREALTLAFEGLPAGTVVTGVRVFLEHHEEPRVVAGDVQWKLAQGSLTAPVVVASTVAPLRSGPGAEALDLWSPATLVSDAGTLKLVVQNDSRDDNTLLDAAWVEVDYLPAEAPPHITSLPATSAVVAQAYRYDADGRAEANGSTPLTWSAPVAPLGLTIDAGGLVTWTPSTTGSFAVTLRATNALGSESQSFVVTVTTQAPLPLSLLPSNPAPISYCPSERLAQGAARTEQRLNLFLPPGTPPPSGWPVVVNTRVGGGLAALPLGRLDSTGTTAPLHAFVAAGIAVVDYGVPGIGSGEGLFYPPGHASGRYESFRPADDNPEKCAEWAVQWAKSQTSFRLDPGRVIVRGSSQGAMLALWAAMGPERARASGSLQVRTSTRARGVLALQPPVSLWAYDQDATLSSRMIAHFEQASLPGVPCTALRQSLRSLQEAASVMRFGFESTAARANNALQPLCLIFNEPVKRLGGVVADMSLDATAYPRLTDAIEQPLVHDSWSGYVLWRRLLDLSSSSAAFHAANSVFAIRDTSALPAPQNWHTRVYSGAITGTAANALAHQWVLRTLGL